MTRCEHVWSYLFKKLNLIGFLFISLNFEVMISIFVVIFSNFEVKIWILNLLQNFEAKGIVLRLDSEYLGYWG